LNYFALRITDKEKSLEYQIDKNYSTIHLQSLHNTVYNLTTENRAIWTMRDWRQMQSRGHCGVARQNGARGKNPSASPLSLTTFQFFTCRPFFLLINHTFCGNFGYLFIFFYFSPKKHQFGAPSRYATALRFTGKD